MDPYAEKQKPWGLYLMLVVILFLAGGWYLGKLDRALTGKIKSTSVLGPNAPGYQPMTNAPAVRPPQ